MSDLTKITIRDRTPWSPDKLGRLSKFRRNGTRFCRSCLASLSDDPNPIEVNVLDDGDDPDFFCSWRCAAKHCAAIAAIDDEGDDPDFKVKWWPT